MDFTDDAIVLSARRHGEANLVLSALTREHGRHLGLVKGGASRKQRAALEIGNGLKVTWRARLEEQLGTFTVEPTGAVAAILLDDPLRLAGLAAACAIADAVLPEREPHADVHAATGALIARITAESENWPADYVRWELGLLAALGFGLDLSHCAATGESAETADLAFVSPKSGRAVSRAGGRGYADRLLPLPRFLTDVSAPAMSSDLLEGLRLTGHFLDQHVLPGARPGAAKVNGPKVNVMADPRLEARARFIERLGARTQ